MPLAISYHGLSDQWTAQPIRILKLRHQMTRQWVEAQPIRTPWLGEDSLFSGAAFDPNEGAEGFLLRILGKAGDNAVIDSV
jgi:hypothetical protein